MSLRGRRVGDLVDTEVLLAEILHVDSAIEVVGRNIARAVADGDKVA